MAATSREVRKEPSWLRERERGGGGDGEKAKEREGARELEDEKDDLGCGRQPVGTAHPPVLCTGRSSAPAASRRSRALSHDALTRPCPGRALFSRQVAYTRRDVLLYALGVGADELRFTYELGRPSERPFDDAGAHSTTRAP